ncbi:armadillo repeat protein-like protein [Hyaloscypha variabilis F]|uniref:Armadillo repeat protein-like protein n=1 Tax=Hyaloscypha variabilis (strain UAMH 11265 / GT02V1 / F) TaxID=1149755 RepID=A0A2J6RK68_HYAVF|nr:armadillo repeat protein-like protein [Hyaloscypha variabilis F]
MARLPWVVQIRNSRNTGEQIEVLRALKNEIVGHPPQKELVVTSGVLEPIIRLTFNKNIARQDGKSHDHSFASKPLSEEEVVRLQCLQVIASIALGGPPFLPPLQAASVLPAILSNLCPSNNPSQLVLASLRALSNLADSSALASTQHDLSTNAIADALFTRQHLNSLYRILSQSSQLASIQTQISIAASLISRLCLDERHQQGLANSGVLDALATRLASFVVAEGLVIPGAENLAQRDGLQDFFPAAAPSGAKLSIILEAIAVIITDSKFRASQLLYSPSILAIFPISQTTEFIAPQNARAAWNAFNAAGLSVRQSQLNAVDYLLPFVPLHQLKSTTASASAFPPLGTSGSRENLAPLGRAATNQYTGAAFSRWSDSLGSDSGTTSLEAIAMDPEEPESPLIAYLILLLRSRTAMTRLMAASVLTVLYRAGLTHKTRETAIGLLVVPLLVQLLDDPVGSSLKGKDSLRDEEEVLLQRATTERTPAILAMLITDSEYLQKAAFDAGVVGKLSKMLKISYDPVPETANSHPWSPAGEEDGLGVDGPSPRLGRNGQSPLLLHKIKVRESTLKAIAALVPFKDDYRKAIVDQGVVPYIVESMSSTPGKPSPKASDKSEKVLNHSPEEESKQGYGTNPVNVLIAACGAVRALSRSVSVLRTTLIDSGVAEPVFRLLQHPDIEVQIAATATVCNLLTDVSPMRQPISEAGVLKILCEHAHSMNAKLRLNALWALKHFVHGVSNEMKRLCLEELGQGWLVQLICDDTEDDALISSRVKPRRSHTPSDEMDEDVEMDQFEDQVDIAFGTSFNHSNTSRPSSSRSKSVQQAELRLAALRDAETNPARKARKDDIAVQEQGLDFIRNLIGGAGNGGTSDTTEMIDFLFNALGQDRVFEILASKLRPRLVSTVTNRRNSSMPEARVVPPQSEIIIAVGYILVHMAASIPRHRQIVISQTELLKLLVPQFNHPSIEVRLALCWLVTNLTWVDDQSDGEACASRADALKKLGFLQKLEMLEQDPELNVRERAKSALWQMKQSY